MTIQFLKCGSPTEVYYGGKIKNENRYKRYRKCTSCPQGFLTVEKVADVEDYATWIENAVQKGGAKNPLQIMHKLVTISGGLKKARLLNRTYPTKKGRFF